MSSEPGVARPFRSFLFAPGNREKLLERGLSAGADAVIWDLEDAVAEDAKGLARTLVAARLQALDGNHPPIHVRVNGLGTGRTEADIMAVVGPGLAAVRLPKAERIQDVDQAAEWIAAAEERAGLHAGQVMLELTIETARGVANVRALAASSSRVVRLVFGSADYVEDIGAELGPDERETLYAQSEVVLASRIAHIGPPAIGAYTHLRDPAGLEEMARRARRLGFFGMSAIHPEQLAVIHQVFTPSAAEVDAARVIVDAYQAAADQGLGAIRLADGRFVDRPIAQRAAGLLHLAQAIRERDPETAP
jgi:citrate lyase subunit beta/citryl-CoA lyase